jgi:cytochrome d ubiquinol oxidase subunit II
METLWFILVSLMLVAYVVLDGFDLGAGIIIPFIAKTDREKQLVIRTVGPVWDGNEVWLLAAGGAIFFAFPLLYASSFSGFYLPLMMVLWLLMLRGIGIELRSHFPDPMWRSFFDFVFVFSSTLLAIFFGAALGNVIRGVPLGPDGYFFEALWTNFRVGPSPGILDWYTVMAGVVALVTLAVHGANYVAVKSEGELQMRARHLGRLLTPVLLLLTILSLVATLYIRPTILNNFYLRPWGWIIPAVVAGSLVAMVSFQAQRKDRAAFLASATFIAAMLGGAAFATYPVLLLATTDPAYSLTVYGARTGDYSMKVGFIWWSIGMVVATGYFIFAYRFFRGKVVLDSDGGH